MSVDQHLLNLLKTQLPNDEYQRLMTLNDQVLQDFLRDATRIYHVKVFVCEFFREQTDDRPYKQVFFTNRFEYGHSSVYNKLEAVNNILTASNETQLIEAEKKLEVLLSQKDNQDGLLYEELD